MDENEICLVWIGVNNKFISTWLTVIDGAQKRKWRHVISIATQWLAGHSTRTNTAVRWCCCKTAELMSAVRRKAGLQWKRDVASASVSQALLVNSETRSKVTMISRNLQTSWRHESSHLWPDTVLASRETQIARRVMKKCTPCSSLSCKRKVVLSQILVELANAVAASCWENDV